MTVPKQWWENSWCLIPQQGAMSTEKFPIVHRQEKKYMPFSFKNVLEDGVKSLILLISTF